MNNNKIDSLGCLSGNCIQVSKWPFKVMLIYRLQSSLQKQKLHINIGNERVYGQIRIKRQWQSIWIHFRWWRNWHALIIMAIANKNALLPLKSKVNRFIRNRLRYKLVGIVFLAGDGEEKKSLRFDSESVIVVVIVKCCHLNHK